MDGRVTSIEVKSPGIHGSKKPGVVLDLNGTLVAYRRREENHPAPPHSHGHAIWTVGKQLYDVVKRPFSDKLLDWIFENCRVGVWTFSGNVRDGTATALAEIALGPDYIRRVDFILDKSHANSEQQKDLSIIWSNFPSWNPRTTVIIDDTPSKVLLQLENAIIVKTFLFDNNQSQPDMRQLDAITDVIKQMKGRFRLC